MTTATAPDRVVAANEVFRLVTDVPLTAEEGIGATVDLGRQGRRDTW